MEQRTTNGTYSNPVSSRVDQMGQSAQELYEQARGAISDIGEMLDLPGRVERNPYGTLLLAAGAGYLLGGGLFTSLTGNMVRLGIRLAAIPFVKDELMAMVQSGIEPPRGRREGGPGAQVS